MPRSSFEVTTSACPELIDIEHSKKTRARPITAYGRQVEGRPYQQCSRCIMDTTDPDIFFDKQGVCNHCHLLDIRLQSEQKDIKQAEIQLEMTVERIKKEGKGRDYDCVIGLSGGVDSSYVAYLVKSLGLRPLAIHVDNGWNSVEAVSNIERIVNKLNIDLQTIVLNWEEFRDLQLSFLKASTPDCDIMADHAIHATLLQNCTKYGTRAMISGGNIATEGVNVPAWSTGITDWKYQRFVHKKFGTVPLKTFPHYTLTQRLYYMLIKGVKRIDILNWVPYNKSTIKDFLVNELGWEDYGGKHHESVYTRFFQSYILPRKFNADKRLMHLSTLIISGQISKEHALEQMRLPICDEDLVESDRLFVIKKLGISESEFLAIMLSPPKCILDYSSYEKSGLYSAGSRFFRKLTKAPPNAFPLNS